MPFDEGLAARLEETIARDFGDLAGLQETRMFGGFGYLLHGNMCLGIHRDTLVLRVGMDQAESFLREAHIRPMDLTGKVMKGWVTVEPEALEEDESLNRYCACAIAFAKTLPPKAKREVDAP